MMANDLIMERKKSVSLVKTLDTKLKIDIKYGSS